MRVWVFALTLTGCGFQGSLGSDAGAPTVIDGAEDTDASSDAAPAPGPGVDASPVDGTVEQVCVGRFLQVCVDPPQAALTLSTQRIDTTSSRMCATTPAIDACVIAGAQITIPVGNTVTVVGGRPLILLSTRGITISGTLDAASHLDRTGPAADTGPCATDFLNPMRNGSGGGWGGSFGTAGGNGGNSPGGVGGGAANPIIATALTGGCAGGNGANNAFGVSAGEGGHSGGAVLLVAAQVLSISIDGVVNASGRGGNPGKGGGVTGGGAGGGGSGGMIVLDAATVDITGACFANGGGGGEGGNAIAGHNGSESPGPNEVGAGGTRGNSTGGTGGAGAFGQTAASPGVNGFVGTQPVPANGGGGGAGGGAGVIEIVAPVQHGTDDPNLVAPLPRS